MCSTINNSFSVFSQLPTKTPTAISFIIYSSIQPQRRTKSMTFSCSYNQSQEQPITTTTTTQPQKSQTETYNIKFKTHKACKLGISIYPNFVYNAEGGIGSGIAKGTNNTGLINEMEVSFDLHALYIPPLTSATTTFLGLPLPPFLKIDIVPELFQGTIDKDSRKVDLEFKAKFLFSVGSIYKAPALVVKTVLTSEESSGTMRRGIGQRLDKEGKCRLVGIATIDPIDDVFMNTFLGLPTECLADMNATIFLSS
ncbi:hypothetical protein GIB67_019221 [Kingdonia uniflora]|uniref:Uncharacterized protein n=1 Tax=Kingdonia uniflora TaxID=39325 RepID=A0A7J7N0C7_9MAGN|nr:hypothetical protein GIB67_019221 [Kingdonia uniflora]